MKNKILVLLACLIFTKSWSGFITTNTQSNSQYVGAFLSNNGKCSVTVIRNNGNTYFLTSAHCVGSCSLDGQFNVFPNLSASVHFKNGYFGNVTRVTINNQNICNLNQINVSNDYAVLDINQIGIAQIPVGANIEQQGQCANIDAHLKGIPGSLWTNTQNMVVGVNVIPMFTVQQRHSNHIESGRLLSLYTKKNLQNAE